MAGKGDTYRKVDQKKYDAGWELAFGDKRKDGTVSTHKYTATELAIQAENVGHRFRLDTNQMEAFTAVKTERDRQDSKWGTIDNFDNRNMHEWMTILTEEVGELAQAFLKNDHDNAIEEATQVAAVAVGILESLHRNRLENRPR